MSRKQSAILHQGRLPPELLLCGLVAPILMTGQHSYAGHFIIEAQKAGYAVPAGFVNKWTSYQRSAASLWKFQPQYRYTCNDQAYRLFTLALAGTPEKGAMNRMKEIQKPSIPVKMAACSCICHNRQT